MKVEQVIHIKELKGKLSQRRIAKLFGVGKTTVLRIHRGETYVKEIKAFKHKKYRRSYLLSCVKGFYVVSHKSRTIDLPTWKLEEKSLKGHHNALEKYCKELRDIYGYSLQLTI